MDLKYSDYPRLGSQMYTSPKCISCCLFISYLQLATCTSIRRGIAIARHTQGPAQIRLSCDMVEGLTLNLAADTVLEKRSRRGGIVVSVIAGNVAAARIRRCYSLGAH